MNDKPPVSLSDELDPLRQEIRESQRVRMDFLKYKLIVVGAIGSIGLGLGNQIIYHVIFSVIPLVCLYIDILCYHNNLRILVIGNFLHKKNDPYEEFISDISKKAKLLGKKGNYVFQFEDFVLQYSTLLLSLLILIFGLIKFGLQFDNAATVLHGESLNFFCFSFYCIIECYESILLIISASVSIVLSFLYLKKYRNRENHILSSGTSFGGIIHNSNLAKYIRNEYSETDLTLLFDLLKNKKTLSFVPFKNGLFGAAKVSLFNAYTGYQNVWLRDNIHIAYAHFFNGQHDVAIKNVKTLARFYIKHIEKIKKIINGEAGFSDSMNRPHIRFNGKSLTEIYQKWNHAQNDAIGYFLWFISLVCNEGHYSLEDDEKNLIVVLVQYLDKIKYWEDEDNGHWEETRKVEASSIGAVVAGLKQIELLFEKGILDKVLTNKKSTFRNLLKQIIKKGEEALNYILPFESRSSEPSKNREYDAALLFLCFPLNVVTEGMQDKIVSNVINNLKGDFGIRRYIGDSYWTSDFKKKMKLLKRTSAESEDSKERDKLHTVGFEAQWCLFDPIISVIYGKKYLKTRKEKDFQNQIHYFNRAVGQITGIDCRFGSFKCPESYYLKKGKYIPNDIVPLYWTQGNLWMAFKVMRESIQIKKQIK